MTQNRPFVIANWKMNPENILLAKKYIKEYKKDISIFKNKINFIICPPEVFLEPLNNELKNSGFDLGAQDVFWENKGSFTGETSVEMLLNTGVKYVIIGHSEQRALGENDFEINKKLRAVVKSKMTAILCIGEKERDQNGEYFEFLRKQIKNAFVGIQKRYLSQVIIAYEPIWAIGKSASFSSDSDSVHQVVIFIKKILNDLYDLNTAHSIKIVYGGSVEIKNTMDLMSNTGVQGFLIGHESLKPKNLFKIVEEIVSSVKNKK